MALLLLISPAAAQDTPTPDTTTAPVSTAIEVAPVVTAAPITVVDGQGKTVVMAEVPLIVYVAVAVLVGVLIAVMVYQAQIIKLVSGLIPPEAARGLIQYGLSLGGEAALSLANQTPTKLDDKLIADLFIKKGYRVTLLEDGTYHIEPPNLVPAPLAAAAPPTTTININNNDAPGAGGAATGSSAPFPDAAG